MGFLVRVLVNAIALWITTHLVPELSFGAKADLMAILGVAVVFGLVNTFLRPVLKILTFPLSLVTLGLFGLVVNGALLLLVAAISSGMGLDFSVGGYPPDLSLPAILWAIVGSVVLGVVSTVLGWVPLPFDR